MVYSVYRVGKQYNSIEEARKDVMLHLKPYPSGAGYYLMKDGLCIGEVWKYSNQKIVWWIGSFRSKEINPDGSLGRTVTLKGNVHFLSDAIPGGKFYPEED